MEDMDYKKVGKKLRYKTEGGEKDGGVGEGESGDDGFSMVEKFSDGEDDVGRREEGGVGG